MPKLPQVKPKNLVKALVKLGFTVQRQTGSHVRLFGLNGQRVTIAIHNKSIATGTLLNILKQANLDKNELIKILK